MKITVLGAGAMGMLFGGYLSKQNEVWLLDVNPAAVNAINSAGVRIAEKDGESHFTPKAVTNSHGLPVMDLIIIFVKSMYTVDALTQNIGLIGKNTYLMTLQNGSGHEAKLLRFADRDHVIIGSTQHNSSVIEPGYANHGGGGKTSIGLLDGDSQRLSAIAENLTQCGISCVTSDDVRRQIWNKLFLNTSASSLTAILQTPLGFIYDDPFAHSIMRRLAGEAVEVANALGMTDFTKQQVIEEIDNVLKNAKGGYTSIYADIKDGRRSEVDTISGSVVDAAKEAGVHVPCHEMVVELIHAMENKISQNRN